MSGSSCDQLRHAHGPLNLINNGVSIEADAVLGLTARIRRFGGYATDEVARAPEPFDACHHWPASSRIDLVQELVPFGRA